MGIAGFTSLGIPLNLTGPEYLEHVSSVFIISLRFCWRNLPLLIGPFQFFNYSSYWSSETIQCSLDQVKQFILAYGYIPDQGTNESPYSFFNSPHRGASIFSPYPSTLSDHLTTTMIDVPPSGYWWFIIAPSKSKSSIPINSCFSSSEKKPRLGWLPLGDKHSYKYWSSCPWSCNFSSIMFGSFNHILIKYFKHISVEITWQQNFLVNNRNYSLMYQLSYRKENTWIGYSLFDTNN